ncbi:hypothetical protein WJX77_010122 [Trebouxia sp. C0004]
MLSCRCLYCRHLQQCEQLGGPHLPCQLKKASVAVACTIWSLHPNRSASSQLFAEPRQASVGGGSEAVYSDQHTPSSTTAKAAYLHQQPAFASISFACIISHAQRTHIVQMLVYQVQRLLTTNILTKLVSVVLLSLPFIVIGGFLYKQASGSSWKEAFFKCYVVLQDVPGADATVVPNDRAALVLHSIFQLGLLTFAVVLGVVCSDISAAVESIQSGNYTVVESGHTVILNWNKLTIPVLRQMAVARAEQQVGACKGPVVVLADMDKAEMDAAVAKGLQGCKMEVMTRSGRPHSIADLEKAAAGRARIIVMLHPEDEEGAAQRKVAAMTGIEALGGGAKAGQNLLIQSGPESTEGDNLLAIAAQGSLPKHMNLGLIKMKDQERMDRLISQCAVQPGLGKVYSQILLQTHTSAEFYLKDMFPALLRKPYAEARRSFNSAVLCGVLDTKTGRAQLNPPDDCLLDTHHLLVFLSSTSDVKPPKQALYKARAHASLPVGTCLSAPHAAIQEIPVIHKKNMVVIGWNVDQTVEGLVNGLGDFAPPGSTVTIVSPDEPDDLPSECGNCCCRHLEGSVASRQVLLEAGVAEADAVILRMPLHSLADNDADAQVVASLIQLQDLALESGRTTPLHVVAPVRHPRTIELRGRDGKVSEQPKLLSVMNDLFDAQGAEIYLRHPSRYNLPTNSNTPMTFSEVSEIARQHQETALGYVLQDGTVISAPSANQQQVLQAGDQIIALAEQA